MRSSAQRSLRAATRRSFITTPRSHLPPRTQRSQPKPLDYIPRPKPQSAADPYYSNPDSLSPANPYGGAGGRFSSSVPYKSAARRITLAMVAAPIVIVTSYVLWQRLVLGQKKKQLLGSSSPIAASDLAGNSNMQQAQARSHAQTGPQTGG